MIAGPSERVVRVVFDVSDEEPGAGNGGGCSASEEKALDFTRGEVLEDENKNFGWNFGDPCWLHERIHVPFQS